MHRLLLEMSEKQNQKEWNQSETMKLKKWTGDRKRVYMKVKKQ